MALASTQRGWILRPPFPRPTSYHLPPFPTELRFPHTSSLETSFFAKQNSREYSFLHLKAEKSCRLRCSNSSTKTVNKGSEEKEDPGGLEFGHSAKSRGQIFLERALSKHDSNHYNTKEKRKKKKKKGPETSMEPACYGCGAPLQTVEVDGPGYVTLETYELKKKHRQLRSVLCGRCQLLSHGHMLTAVGGHGGYSGGKQFISAEQLREKLSHLRHDKALIVKLVDIVDFNGSFLARVRDLVGANPIIMVATKVDLLPKGTDLSVVGDWVVEATMRKKLNVLSIHLTSSKSLSGLVGVVSEIQQQRKGRDVYVLGSANVGKSAFINALLKTMALKDFVAAAARRYKPIQSAVPGTTLGPIQIDAFHGEGKLYDTPGVHLHHRQAAVVHAEDLPLLAPQSRLKGNTISTDALTKENQELFYISKATCSTVGTGLNGLSIFWGGLVRIDVVKVPLHIRLILYGPKGVPITVVPTSEAEEFYHNELGEVLKPPTGKEKAKNWPGLKGIHPIDVKMENNSRPVCDIAISGLGWIAIEPGPSGNATSAEDLDTAIEPGPSGNATSAEDLDTMSTIAKQLHLLVHVAKPVEVFVRPPMPIGRLGSTWYEYSELTETEEATRPKVSY